MRYEIALRRQLEKMFGGYAKDLDANLIVGPQAMMRISARSVLEQNTWGHITDIVEARGGCWENEERVWKTPWFFDRMNLPASDKKPNSVRLHVRSRTLQNLIFLHDAFGYKPPHNWKEVQSALLSFRPQRTGGRSKYSRAACRDYVGALLALET